MADGNTSKIVQLEKLNVVKGQSSVSGLSSGAFMTVQLHLAHSSSFCGAGIIAGGPFRCAESSRDSALLAEDANEQNALYICMTPLTSRMAPNAEILAAKARMTADAKKIDAIANLKSHRLYIFTGRKDTIVYSSVVARTRDFYQHLGVDPDNIEYIDTVEAGHAILTENPADSPLDTNGPPYINYNDGKGWQSHDILRHIYGKLEDPAPPQCMSGELVRFDQKEFFQDDHERERASMSKYGYLYLPKSAKDKQEVRVHIALHGGKQGYNYVNFVYGRANTANQPPYGNRYITTTGYNQIADTNNIVVLYPQVEGRDDQAAQNPDGEWDWWGYSSSVPERPDYYSRDAIQIKAIYGMLSRLGG